MNFLYESLYRDMHNERIARAAAERLIKQALKNDQTAVPRPSPNIINLLRKYSQKMVSVYNNLYQLSKSLRTIRN